MSEKKKKDDKPFNDPIIDDENGLKIHYDKKEFTTHFPNLMSELCNDKNLNAKGKSINLNEINEILNANITCSQQLNDSEIKELTCPGAIDFIRRCSTKEQAIDIISYLLKRKEINQEEYNELVRRLNENEGLERLIEESGGFKRPGYYERKFYLTRKQKIEDFQVENKNEKSEKKDDELNDKKNYCS